MNNVLIILGTAEISSALLHFLATLLITSFAAPKRIKATIAGFFIVTALTQIGLGAYWIAHAADPQAEPMTLAAWMVVGCMVARAYALNAVTGMSLAWLWRHKDGPHKAEES